MTFSNIFLKNLNTTLVPLPKVKYSFKSSAQNLSHVQIHVPRALWMWKLQIYVCFSDVCKELSFPVARDRLNPNNNGIDTNGTVGPISDWGNQPLWTGPVVITAARRQTQSKHGMHHTTGKESNSVQLELLQLPVCLFSDW